MAFTPTHQAVFVQQPLAGVAQLLPADTTTKKTFITATANGDKIVSITVATTETALAHDIQFFLLRGGVSYLLITVTIPVNAGLIGTVAPINVFSNWILPTDNDGQKYLYLESGDVIQVAALSTVNTGKEVDFVATRGAL